MKKMTSRNVETRATASGSVTSGYSNIPRLFRFQEAQ